MPVPSTPTTSTTLVGSAGATATTPAPAIASRPPAAAPASGAAAPASSLPATGSRSNDLALAALGVLLLGGLLLAVATGPHRRH